MTQTISYRDLYRDVLELLDELQDLRAWLAAGELSHRTYLHARASCFARLDAYPLSIQRQVARRLQEVR